MKREYVLPRGPQRCSVLSTVCTAKLGPCTVQGMGSAGYVHYSAVSGMGTVRLASQAVTTWAVLLLRAVRMNVRNTPKAPACEKISLHGHRRYHDATML